MGDDRSTGVARIEVLPPLYPCEAFEYGQTGHRRIEKRPDIKQER